MPSMLSKMAPVANNNNNNNSNNNNSNRRTTGTVPKTKTVKKNSVPQEMVVPTRRDLQQQINELVGWTSASSPHQSHASGIAAGTYPKPQNNRTPGEGASFDIDHLSLQDNSRFIPVRPIVRRNLLHEEMSEISGASAASTSQNQSNTAIGIVIPTQPSQQASDSFASAFSMPGRTTRELASSSGHHNPSRSTQQQHQQQNQSLNLPARATVEDKLSQIQEYIKITSSLLNSMQVDDSNKDKHSRLIKSLEDLNDSENKLKNILSVHYNYKVAANNKPTMENNHYNSEEMNHHYHHAEENGAIESNNLDDVDRESLSARAQSISSIHTTSEPNTPTYEELRTKVDLQQRNMNNIKEQQSQLIVLQNMAKQQLYELEKARTTQTDKSCPSHHTNGLPNYDNVEQVQDDVSSLMNRMKTLTNFIQNQTDLSSLLGDDGEEILSEQMMLQKKLFELKSKKQMMDNLVAELSTLNTNADERFDEREVTPTPTRNVPIEYQRIVPIEMVGNSNNRFVTEGSDNTIPVERVADQLGGIATKDEGDQSAFGDKIAEINAMKDQLKRLKHMMDTVKLIELKNGGPEEDDEEEEEEERDEDQYHNDSHEGAESTEPEHDENYVTKTRPNIHGQHVQQTEQDDTQINQRVVELQSITQNLRQQALSLVAQRDLIRSAREDLVTKTNETTGSIAKEINQQTSKEHTPQKRGVTPQRIPDIDAKKKEYEKLLKSIEKEVDQAASSVASSTTSSKRPETEYLYYPEQWHGQQNHVIPNSMHDQRPAGVKVKVMPFPNIPGKDSADSGAADLMNIELGSVQSGSIPSISTRSLSMPPPMPNLSERNSNWRKTSQESSTLSSSVNHTNIHQTQQSNYCNSSRGPYSPWMMHHHSYNPNPECQSPLWHHSAAPPPPQPQSHPEGHHYFPLYHLPSSNINPDMLQEFLQTQQMLVNTICKCNELLWSQQKEINTLNNAVLWLQEKFIAQSTSQANANLESLQQQIRGESVPPHHPGGGITMQPSQFYSRAQSEQPSAPAIYANPSPISPLRTYHNYNLLRQQNTTAPTSTSSRPPLPSHPALNMYQNYPNYFQLQQNDLTSANGPQSQAPPPPPPTILNNNAALPQNHDSPPIFMHHNNNIATSNNKLMQNLNTNAQSSAGGGGVPQSVAPPPSSGSAFNASGPSALNNQVPPGNRANNYWDNFRSYSRQNLLSSNSCKSNDGGSCISSSTSNYHGNITNQDRGSGGSAGRNQHMTYNNQFRNQFNQLNISGQHQPQDIGINLNQHGGTAGDCTESPHIDSTGTQTQPQQQSQSQPQQQQQQQHASVAVVGGNDSLNENLVTNHFNSSNLESSSSLLLLNELNDSDAATAAANCMNSLYNFHTNPINLGVYEFNTKSKTLPGKGNDNNKKRLRHQLRPNFYDSNDCGSDGDLNLAAANRMTSGQQNNNVNTATKTSSKMFEALKENVYQEVSALIAANETRPHFLIQLFRDLQLISSDPLRQRTLQSIQELYNRYIETVIHDECSPMSGDIDLNRNSVSNLETNKTPLDVPTFAPSAPPQTQQQHDDDIIPLILQDVSKFLQTVDKINENVLQTIHAIFMSHLVSPSAASVKSSISHDDLTKALATFNLNNKDEFLLSFESLLSKPDPSLDARQATASSSFVDDKEITDFQHDDASSVLNSNNDQEGAFAAPVIFPLNHNSSNLPINEDLAEADQICTNDNNSFENNDHCDMEEGAVGGNPDLIMHSTNNQEVDYSNENHESPIHNHHLQLDLTKSTKKS